MIHYHGTPLTPRDKLLTMAGKHFCVSFAEPRDADMCLQIGQSVMFDNGAFSIFRRGAVVDWNKYYEWLEPRLGHPHWAVVPDVIDGSVEQQQELRFKWPFRKDLGAPVWHMGLKITYLLGLAEAHPRICFGSTAQYWQINSDGWRRRADEAFNELSKRHKKLPWIHMLRGMSLAGERWPFASVDSVNVARNFKCAGREPRSMADDLDRVQGPIGWIEQPEQQEIFACSA